MQAVKKRKRRMQLEPFACAGVALKRQVVEGWNWNGVAQQTRADNALGQAASALLCGQCRSVAVPSTQRRDGTKANDIRPITVVIPSNIV